MSPADAPALRCRRCHRTLRSPQPHGYGPVCARTVGAATARQRTLPGCDDGAPGPLACTGDVWRCDCTRCVGDRESVRRQREGMLMDGELST